MLFRPRPRRPRIVLEACPDGRVEVLCDWPAYPTDEARAEGGRLLAKMLYFANDGQLLPLLLQAVAVAGHIKGEDRLSEYVIGQLQAMLQHGDGEGGRGHECVDDGDGDEPPMVGAGEVFSR